jgi:hypothetical protein
MLSEIIRGRKEFSDSIFAAFRASLALMFIACRYESVEKQIRITDSSAAFLVFSYIYTAPKGDSGFNLWQRRHISPRNPSTRLHRNPFGSVEDIDLSREEASLFACFLFHCSPAAFWICYLAAFWVCIECILLVLFSLFKLNVFSLYSIHFSIESTVDCHWPWNVYQSVYVVDWASSIHRQVGGIQRVCIIIFSFWHQSSVISPMDERSLRFGIWY